MSDAAAGESSLLVSLWDVYEAVSEAGMFGGGSDPVTGLPYRLTDRMPYQTLTNCWHWINHPQVPPQQLPSHRLLSGNELARWPAAAKCRFADAVSSLAAYAELQRACLDMIFPGKVSSRQSLAACAW